MTTSQQIRFCTAVDGVRIAYAIVGIWRGLANREIADALSISEKTVKSHVGSILVKLEARDRSQAIVRAFDSGLVVRES